MKCPKCGIRNRSGAKFCIECGTPLTPSPQQGKNLKSWLVAALTVVAVAAVGFAAYLIGSRPPGDGGTTEGGTAAPVATSLTPTHPKPVTPSPTPDTRLFWDDFETGIKPDWNMKGDNFNAVNGYLVSTGRLQGSVGDYTWTDYRVVFTGWSFSNMTLQFRVQDENHYMQMSCDDDHRCSWYKVSGDQFKEVPGVSHYLPRKPAIEVEGDTYRVIDLENGNTLVTFVDDTVSFGGITLAGYNLSLDAFEVYPLP